MSWASIAKTQPKASADSSSVALTAKDGLKLLVVDANAIIDGVRLEGIADRAVTIQEVLDEIRDKQSRQYLANLPYELEVSEPSEDSIKAGELVLMLKLFCFGTGSVHVEVVALLCPGAAKCA
jgi:RNA-binding protein NOB1